MIDLLQPSVDKAFEMLIDQGVATLADKPILQRNTLQSDRGGYDIVGLPWLALEVKNAATLQVPAWWKQTLAQTPRDAMPLLLWKQAGGRGWRARTKAHVSTFGAANMWYADAVIDVDIPTLQGMLVQCVYHNEGMRLWHEQQRKRGQQNYGVNGHVH